MTAPATTLAPNSRRPLALLETFALIQVGAMVLFGTWAFGGNTPWARATLQWVGSLSGGILLAVLFDRELRELGRLRLLHALWPLGLFNAMVLVSAYNPNLRELTAGAERLWVPGGENPSLPSAARPADALQALWLFDAIYLSCFNLLLVVRQRRALRGLLIVVGSNTLILAVFGSVQKLTGAQGLYFDLVAAPNIAFFASFLYHNHWGAYALLMVASGLALSWHYARKGGHDYRDFWHSPASLWIVAIVTLAATMPLSTSRSCTTLVVLLLLGAFLHWATQTLRQRRRENRSVAPPIVGVCLTMLLAAAAISWLAYPVIERRLAITQEQIADMQARGSIGTRATVYHDTWRMAEAKRWFGWGMGSYPAVFPFYNSLNSYRNIETIVYEDAHSDWLQALAEVGFIGTGLLGLHALLPLLLLGLKKIWRSRWALYHLAGCALIALYAWLEFPFGNPVVVLVWWLCFFSALRYARLEPEATASGH